MEYVTTPNIPTHCGRVANPLVMKAVEMLATLSPGKSICVTLNELGKTTPSSFRASLVHQIGKGRVRVLKSPDGECIYILAVTEKRK